MKNASSPHASLKCIALALAGCSACAHGADDLTELSLDQLIDVPVVSASRFEQKASETTAAVSVVTRDDIRQFGWRTVAEVLRSLHGFYTHSDRGYDYVGARSFARPQDYNTRVLLLVDGQRVNDAVYDQAYIGTDGIIDLDIVDRIEVIRGPGSSIYGGNAVFGVINLITRSGAQLDGGELGARISSHNTIDGRASVGKRLDNGADFLASVSGMNATGPALYFPEFDTPANNGGHTAHTDYTRQGSVFARVGIDGLRLTTAASRRTKGVPTGAFGAEFNDRGHAFIDTQSYLAVDYTRALDAATELSGRAYLSDYTYSAPALLGSPPVRNHDEAHGSWYGAELKLVSSLSARNKLVAGIEHQRNRIQNQRNYDVAPYRLNADDHRQSERSGVFVQDDFQWTPDLKLSVGGRVDQVTGQGAQFSPRLGAVYRLSAQTVWKLQYGTAFRAPNVYESNYSYAGSAIANPRLRGEKITTWETSVEHYLDSQTRLLGTAYVYRLAGLIDQTTEARSGLLQYVNAGRSSARGVELEIEKLWTNGARLRTSLELQHAHDATGNDLTNSPNVIGKLNLSVPLPWQSLRLGTEAQWFAARKTHAGMVPDHGLANLTLLRPMAGNHWEWSASVYNLFDNRYFDATAYDPTVPQRDRLAQDGRSYRLKAVYRF